MIHFNRTLLRNGLTVLCNTDRNTPFVSVNILYKVGSRNEQDTRTGFAHLFEHLMFGGSAHVEDYDRHVQLAGGDSNAYTTNDLTNYYITIPADNIETALWLESDRMAALNFSQHALDVQKQVVIEEFKQRYLNNPYGDVWLKLRPLAYQVHPYRWPTIGMSPEHIEKATLTDVKNFFHHYYAPNNAIISLSGNIETDKAFSLVEKWFGDIPAHHLPLPEIPGEPLQTRERRLVIPDNDVPADAIYKVYHMGGRTSENFYTCDIISDILSNGQSSRLYVNLLRNSRLFSAIDAYVSGDKDPGLFIFSGKLSEGTTIGQADQAIEEEIEKFIRDTISERELQKVIHKTESRISFSEINYQTKATNLAFFEFLNNPELINTEASHYLAVTPEKIKTTAIGTFRKENCSTLWYLKKKN
ncbi:pitrilysin family protein [Odoribacter sp. Z80]|uniref:M16 family metallopeptidase n=1 Tax=Odoribacter sp. Z80 TaxID=2304575 RepID=UPI00137B2150|nr:pitrilysin family protein [Odoribacter sp. Z80]NCE73037.1 insulinase family protein [Odoribacter sp. Z80]